MNAYFAVLRHQMSMKKKVEKVQKSLIQENIIFKFCYCHLIFKRHQIYVKKLQIPSFLASNLQILYDCQYQFKLTQENCFQNFSQKKESIKHFKTITLSILESISHPNRQNSSHFPPIKITTKVIPSLNSFAATTNRLYFPLHSLFITFVFL